MVSGSPHSFPLPSCIPDLHFKKWLQTSFEVIKPVWGQESTIFGAHFTLGWATVWKI